MAKVVSYGCSRCFHNYYTSVGAQCPLCGSPGLPAKGGPMRGKMKGRPNSGGIVVSAKVSKTLAASFDRYLETQGSQSRSKWIRDRIEEAIGGEDELTQPLPF